MGGLLLTMAATLVTAESSVKDVSIRHELVKLPLEEAPSLFFHRLSTADGLAQTRVHEIIQDDMGFVWLGTQYGVDRFDGYNFKHFVHEPSNPHSVAGTMVLALFKDREGFIWIGWAEGVDRLDPKTETVTHYPVGPGANNMLVGRVRFISQDHAGMIWLATGSGLGRLDPRTGKVTQFSVGQVKLGLPTNDINWSGEDSHGRFWVGTGLGLCEFNRDKGTVTRFIEMSDGNRVRLIEDNKGHFWITQTTGHGLTAFNPETNQLTPYFLYNQNTGPGALTGVEDVAEDVEGNLWLATMGNGLLRLNRERSRLYRYTSQPQDVHSIAENEVTAVLPDRDGNIWVGLHSAGVNYSQSGAQRYETFHNIPGDTNSLTLNFVNAIFEDRDGILWIGNDDGLNRIDRATGKRQIVDLGLGEKPSVITITQDQEGFIWAGTNGQGVARYDPSTHRAVTFHNDSADPNSLSHNFVHRIQVDHSGTVWIGTEDGLSRFDPALHRFSIYRVSNENRFGQSYTGIAEDSAGSLWLSTNSSGVHHYDVKTRQLTVLPHTGAAEGGLSDAILPNLLMSHRGTLWIATQNGLDRIDPKTGAIRTYGTRNGMPANAVACLLEDDAGAIWLSTTRGISRFTPESETFTNYSLFTGLSGNDFTGWGSCNKGRQGELYFAGFSGAVGFYPSSLEGNVQAAHLVLTDLFVDGVAARIGPDELLTQAVTFTEKITLSPYVRSLAIGFAGLYYSSPESMRYRYRLEGLDKDDWQESLSSVRQASYTTLPSGHYVFHVQMSTARGTWQEPGVLLRVIIPPPWWATWWFRSISVVVLGILAGLVVHARVRSVARAVTLKMEARSEERMRIARDLHDTLLQGLVSASMQLSVVQEETEPSAKSMPLLKHVENLLRQLVVEGRTAVRGLRVRAAESEDLERVIATIPSDLRIESTAVLKVAIVGTSRVMVPVARTEVYLIIREAISNALRHANANIIDVTLEYLPETFKITVKDDGRGFLAEAASGVLSNHFGLSVMQERAERLGGTLKVYSRSGLGTEIILSIPAASFYSPDSKYSA